MAYWDCIFTPCSFPPPSRTNRSFTDFEMSVEVLVIVRGHILYPRVSLKKKRSSLPTRYGICYWLRLKP